LVVHNICLVDTNSLCTPRAMKSASAVSCSSCSYCDAIRVKGTPYPLFRVWELAVSFLGLPPLPLVPREDTKSQANSPTAERSGLQTRIATTESVSLCVRMRN
jgi:hypothetical protein